MEGREKLVWGVQVCVNANNTWLSSDPADTDLSLFFHKYSLMWVMDQNPAQYWEFNGPYPKRFRISGLLELAHTSFKSLF